MSNETAGYKALILTPEGEVRSETISEQESLNFLQRQVGGYIEAVYGWLGNPTNTGPEVTFFINDEGKILNLPANVAATALWWTLCPEAAGADYLHGVVVVTGGADRDGNTLSVPQQVIGIVERAGGN